MSTRDDLTAALAASRLPPKQEAKARAVLDALPSPDWQGAVRGLASAGLAGAALALAEKAVERFTADAWPLAEAAALYTAREDQQAALRCGEQLMRALPEHPEGFRIAIGALIALGRLDEAQTLFRDLSLDPAQHVLHREEWFLLQGLELARERGDHLTAVLYATALREVNPDHVRGYTGGFAALRQLERFEEAEAVAAEGIARHADALPVWKDWAHAAEDLKKPDDAYARWAEIRAHFPKSPAGHIGAIRLASKLTQPAVMQSLLADALAAFPENQHIADAAARAAMRSNRVDEAMGHWQKIAARKPEDPAIPLAAATALMRQRRHRKKHMPEVLRRLEKLHKKFPDYVPAYVAHLNALRETGDLEDARKLGRQWGERFADSAELAMARAAISDDLKAFDEAVKILDQVRRRTAPLPALEAAFSKALCAAGRAEDADAAISAALARNPAAPALLAENVRLATRRDDWPEAMRRARHALLQRPRDRTMVQLLQSVRSQIIEGGAAEDEDAAPASADAELMLQFESLGATSAGCEFGIVQRRFGAEPLGLFRWALIGIDKLTAALDGQLAEVGAEDTTELVIRRESASHQEYYIVDRKVGYLTHTFVKVEDSPFDRMLKQSIRRIRFLREKLIEDLRAAEKIFVYKYAAKFDEAALRRLFASVRQYGNGTLLCMTLADAQHPRGDLTMLEPGLFVGRTGMFMDAVVPDEQGVDTDMWRQHCRAVAAWHAAQKLSAAA